LIDEGILVAETRFDSKEEHGGSEVIGAGEGMTKTCFFGCKFFFAISALSIDPLSRSTFLLLSTSIASIACCLVLNLANPILCFFPATPPIPPIPLAPPFIPFPFEAGLAQASLLKNSSLPYSSKLVLAELTPLPDPSLPSPPLKAEE